jgi:hypothetical protein
MTTEVLIGSHSAIVGHRQAYDSVTYERLSGPQICRLLIPEDIVKNLPLCTASIAATLPKHIQGGPPEWVESTDLGLAMSLAQILKIPTTRPDNWEATDEN